MRARGAKVTDIVVLVVAADDGVMPQTIEAINHAKAAKVPMIVAINKIDKPDAKPERVRTELLQHEVQVESLGGDVVDVEVSATKKTNLDKLLEMIGLQAEILDLKANPTRAAEGTVIEAKLDRGRGPVATVLVQRGTLHIGDIIVAGAEWGRVRALVNDKGETVQEAGPSVPVEVLGFAGTPEAGDRLAVVENEARARELTDYRVRQKRENTTARNTGMRGSLEQMMSQLKTTGRKEFPLIIKADVQGSLEAIVGSLDKLGTDEVAARVIHSGVGGITESDVTLSHSSGAAIIGFNVRAHKEARELAERDGVEIRYYNIIYDLVDDVKKAMSGLLTPERRETMLGNATILEVFNVSKVGKVAGCRVTDGKVERGAGVRLIRDNVVVHEGKLSAAQALQGRRARGDRRPGMRHGLRELPGHAARRRHRVLSGGDGATLALSPNLRLARNPPPSHVMPGASAGHPRHPGENDRAWMCRDQVRPSTDDDVGENVHSTKHHRDNTPGGSQRQLRVGELDPPRDVRHADARRRARSGARRPSHHRARGAHDRPTCGSRRSTSCRSAAATSRRCSRRWSATSAILRGEIAHHVNLKFAPDIRFHADERFAEAERIEKLLRTPAVQRDLKRDEGDE